MSTEVATQPQSEDNNIDNNYDKSTEQTQEQQSSLDTPSRDSNATSSTVNNEITTNGTGGSTPMNSEKVIDKIEETKIIKYSNIKSTDNPLTIAREKAKKEGRPLMVNFDERVVVHTVPYWDPCGETFYDNDDEDGPRGPNCCIIL